MQQSDTICTVVVPSEIMEKLGRSQPLPPPRHLLSPGEPGNPEGPGPPTLLLPPTAREVL